MHKFTRLLILIFTGLTLYSTSFAQKENKEKAFSALLKQNIVFHKNVGQWDQNYEYLVRSFSGNSYFSKNKVVNAHPVMDKGTYSYHNWQVEFINASEGVKIVPEFPSSEVVNYISSGVCSKVPAFKKITYTSIYQGIDFQYYGYGQNLKYDVVVHPQADVSQVKLKVSECLNLEISSTGSLIIHHPWGTTEEETPVSFQKKNGKRHLVDVVYRIIDKSTFGYVIKGAYDPSVELVIDPVTLKWGTYLGGSDGLSEGYLYDLTTDIDGHVYATGYYPASFPVTPYAFDKSYNGTTVKGGDIFVAKLDKDGEYLHYATYIGGKNDDRGFGIAVNNYGEAYLTGETYSTDFPVTDGAFQNKLSFSKEAFALRLSFDGSSLIYSTFLGGMDEDKGNDIAVDNNGFAYIVGETKSSGNFPVKPGSFQTTYNGGPHDGFIVKLEPDGKSVVYSTFLGGDQNDIAKAIVLNSNLDPVITGYTNSANYPVSASAYDQTYNGGLDVFVTQLNASGTELLSSTYLGGSYAEEATDIDVNEENEIFLTGYTFSGDFPNTYPAEKLMGLKDVFVARISSDASTLLYSRLVGGTKNDEGTSILVNAEDQAFVAGTSESEKFPEVESGVPILSNADDKLFQVFLFMLDENGEQLKKSIHLGGSYDDYKIPSLSFPDKNAICDVAIGFTSHSPDLNTTASAFQRTKLNGGAENDQPAIFKLYFGPEPVVVPESESFKGCLGDTIELIAMEKPIDSVLYPYQWTYLWADGDTSRIITTTIPEGSDSTFVIISDGCSSDTTIFYLTEIKPPYSPNLSNGTLCAGKSIELKATIVGEDMEYLWNNGSTSPVIFADTAGFYKVIITNQCGIAKDSITLAPGTEPTASLGADRTYCFPGKYTLASDYTDGGLPITYEWSTKEYTESIEIEEPGTYSFTVSNLCGTAEAEITIDALYVPDLELGPDTSMCEHSSIQLTSGHHADEIIYWSTGEISPDIMVSDTGVYWVQITNICGTSIDSIYVGRSAEAPLVKLGKDTIICGEFELILNAGSPGDNYYWSTKDTSQIITVEKGGTYSVTATNGCGSHTDTIVVTSDPDLVLELPESIDKCADQVELKAQEPGAETTYLWSTGEVTKTITATESGIYWVKAENVCGESTDSIEVQLFQTPPQPLLGNDSTICRNDFISLSPNIEGTEFIWSTGETSETIQASAAGLYWVKVKNSCGENSDSITVSHIPALKSVLEESRRICTGKNLTLNPGSNDASYLWSTGETSEQITVTSEGLYQVTISNQCESIQDLIFIFVDNGLPVVSLGEDTTICELEFVMELTGSESEGEFLWQPTAEDSKTISIKEGGSYTLTVTNGCGSNSDSKAIIAHPLAYLPPSERVCESGTVVLDAKNNYPGTNYLWSTGETTKTISVTESGIYWVTIENTCGTASDTIPVSLDSTPPVVDIKDARICEGEEALLDAKNVGSAYLWSTGTDSREISVRSQGKYWVEVTNGCGKSVDSAFVQVDQANPNAGADKTFNLCIPFTQTLVAPSTGDVYKWIPGNQTTSSKKVTAPGTYELIISNACGSDSINYIVNGFNFPSANLGPDIALCADSTLLDPNYTEAAFFWTPTQETSNIIAVYQTGSYKVQAHNICGIVSDSIFVILDKRIPEVNLGVDTSLCTPEGYTFKVETSPGSTLLWKPSNETTSSVQINELGVWSVEVTNQCGTSTDSIKVSENIVQVNAGNDTSVCYNTEITLTTIANPDYSYRWYIGDSLYASSEKYAFNAVNDTTYILKASDGICYNFDSLSVSVYSVSKPEISASPLEGYIPLSVTFYNKNQISGLGYEWDFGDGSKSDEEAPKRIFTEEQIYDVVLKTITPEGCEAYDSTRILAFDLFIPNLITPNGDQKNDSFDLTNLNPYLQVHIYNRWGDLVFSQESYTDEFAAQDLSDGVYYYTVIDTRYGKEFNGWLMVVRK